MPSWLHSLLTPIVVSVVAINSVWIYFIVTRREIKSDKQQDRREEVSLLGIFFGNKDASRRKIC